jgi:hypothetical protein
MIRRALENRWAFAPVLLLLLSVGICATGVTLALRGADAAEPDYYRKGAAYDEGKEQARRNERIGWVVTPELVASTADPRFARLRLTVADKHGIRIDPASVSVEVIPIRDAAQRVTIVLDRAAEGRYEHDVPLRSGGLWEFRVQVESRGTRYTDTFRRPVRFGPRQELGA